MRPGAHNSDWDASLSDERPERGRIASVTFLTRDIVAAVERVVPIGGQLAAGAPGFAK
jgi:hypothetical protein